MIQVKKKKKKKLPVLRQVEGTAGCIVIVYENVSISQSVSSATGVSPNQDNT